MNVTGLCRQMKRASRVLARPTSIVVAGLFASALTPKAEAGGCGVATLHGSYGISTTATISGVGPVAVGGIVVFDGSGAMSSDVMVNYDGTPFRASPTATYTVDSDCTVTISLSDGETLFGAIVNGAREVQFINATPGFLGSTGVAKKVILD